MVWISHWLEYPFKTTRVLTPPTVSILCSDLVPGEDTTALYYSFGRRREAAITIYNSFCLTGIKRSASLQAYGPPCIATNCRVVWHFATTTKYLHIIRLTEVVLIPHAPSIIQITYFCSLIISRNILIGNIIYPVLIYWFFDYRYLSPNVEQVWLWVSNVLYIIRHFRGCVMVQGSGSISEL